MKQKSTLEGLLKQYAAMAIPVITLNTIASAQNIIYHDVVPDYEFTTSPGTSSALHLDIDGDGGLDLNLRVVSHIGGFNSAGARPHSANGNKILGFLNSSSYYAGALSSGESINGDQNFWSQIVQYGEMMLYLLPNGSSGIYGEWQGNVTDKFLGFRFAGGDSMKHYGWIRMDVFQDPVKIVVKDWAFEADSAFGIAAGDKCNPFFPDITAGGDTAFCEGGSVLLQTDSIANNSYEWMKDSQPIPGATDSKYTAESQGNFDVVLTDTLGCTGSSPVITVNVFPLPPQPAIIQNTDSLYCTEAASAYQWFFSGNAINGATNQNYVPAQSGLYSVMITDANGCSSTSEQFDFIALSSVVYAEDVLIIFSKGKIISVEFNNEALLNKRFTIFNLMGSIIVSGNLKSSPMNIDLSYEPAAIYMVQIETSSGLIARKVNLQ